MISSASGSKFDMISGGLEVGMGTVVVVGEKPLAGHGDFLSAVLQQAGQLRAPTDDDIAFEALATDDAPVLPVLVLPDIADPDFFHALHPTFGNSIKSPALSRASAMSNSQSSEV